MRTCSPYTMMIGLTASLIVAVAMPQILQAADEDATARVREMLHRTQEALRQAQLTIYRHPERIADLANRERPNFHKTVALPPDVTPEGAKRTPTRLWAAFQVSGVGQ